MIKQLSRYPVYMDHHATTPVDRRVLDVMLPYFSEIHGNAASVDHVYGNQAQQAVQQARDQIARIINARPREIIFTSGATESDNLAILGIAEQYAAKGKHIITAQIEHKAVLDCCHALEQRGWQVTYLPVDSQGVVNPDDVRQAITPQTVLVTLMAANNEIGVLTDLAAIGAITREHDVFFHTDATQAVSHIPIDVEAMNIDLLSLSAHKIYGPKGIGALYVRSSRPRVRLAEQLHGGGHERGMRSGTLNVTGIVGLGAAIELATQEMQRESKRLGELRDQLWTLLKTDLPEIELNGHPTQRLPHNLNIVIPNMESRSMLLQLKHDVALSTGSACTTLNVEPSHVLLAMGFSAEHAHSSLRFGLGRENGSADITFVAQKIISTVRRLRQFF